MRNKLIGVMLLILIVILSTPLLAGATIYEGKWIGNVDYYMSISNPYYSYFQTAINNWNSVSKCDYVPTTVTSAEVVLNAENYGDNNYIGKGVPGPSLTGTYTYATLWMNRYYCDNFITDKKVSCITHEMGHVLGLEHAPPTYESIMHAGQLNATAYDLWKLIVPSGYDINDINYIYP